MDITQVKTQLAYRAESVARLLFPNGVKRGAEWCVGSLGGEKGESLRVHLVGDKSGIWSDFATGQGGDLLDLYGLVKGVSLPDALKWAKDYLGIIEPQIQRVQEAKPYRRPQVKNVIVPKNGALNYLTTQRALKAETIKAFQIGEQEARTFKLSGDKTYVCPAVVFPYKAEGELRFVKYLGIERPDGERLMSAEAGCEQILFGWQAMPANARFVVIVEGELNAMSWHQYGIPALATPLGAGSGNKHGWVASEWNRLEQFEIVYLSFDQDKPGRDAVADLVERLGRHRCRIVPPMPNDHKDINDCLYAGVSAAEIQGLLDMARSIDPEGLRSATDFTDEVIEQFYPTDNEQLGIPMPFAGFKDKFAFRPGEMTIVTGYRGHGKTQGVNYIVNQALAHGAKALIASFEMRAKVLLRRAVRQLTAQREPSKEYIKQVMNWYYDRLWLFDHVGSANQDRIFEVFDYARRRYGINLFVIDSLMKCGIAVDDLPGQDRFADRYVNFCNLNSVHGILVAHSRKDDDENNVPTNNGVKGSGGITDQAHNVLAMWRNKMKERAQQKLLEGQSLTKQEEKALEGYDAIWSTDKQREGDGWIGDIGLAFDPDSQQFVTPTERVEAMVPFIVPSGAGEIETYPEF